MRVAIYVRVSTQDQSCELQRRELTDYASARGWVIMQVLEDVATGTNARRPKLQELLRLARGRQLDLVLVWKLDRFARSLRDLVTMLQELHELGVDFVSLKDQIDMTTSAGRLMLHMLGAFGEFEASLIRERVRSGLANARAKGKKLGRPRLEIDPRFLKLKEDGLSIRQIAARLGIPRSTVQRALSRITSELSFKTR